MNSGSLDWGNELVKTIGWTLWVSAASLAGLVVVGALLARYTKWGRQYWRVTGGFFTERRIAPMTWLLVVILLLLAIFGVRLNVLFTYQGLDMYNAIQDGASALGKPASDPARAGAWPWPTGWRRACT